VLTTHGRNSTLTLDVAGSSLRLARGEELAAILFRKDGRPWTTTNPYGEAMILPIGLAAGPRLAPPTRYEVNLRNVKASAARMFVHVSLYVLSTDPATQIATANVIHH